MTDVSRGPKRPVNTMLSEDLARAACSPTINLSDMVEKLLADYVGARNASAKTRNA